MKYPFNYLVEIQYLGFRFHGWQKQKDVKTLHDMVDKTLSFVFENEKYKTIGIGRTDAMVSANKYYFQLLMYVEIDQVEFMNSFNSNLSQDILCKSIKVLPQRFDIINCSKIKEYHYYFSFGEKAHPFSAPFITNILGELDIEKMILGAKLFKGVHYFHKYCTKPSNQTIFKRVISSCEIVENTEFTASFFPEKSYVLKIQSKGFLRYQIRLIMAVLFELGKGEVDLRFIEESLSKNNDRKYLRSIAPASGLQLYDIHLEM
ncbi:MAG: tRNA pseudouridine(38-40) synthase TruA [Flavobacteriaceae bacterium]|nr:tRNA pseudouridine(38-40) synthase TruA [Flavobacteriaceae bacterium]